MKDQIPSQIELLKNRIQAEEYKYKNAIERNKNYVVVKKIKSRIRELTNNLHRLTGKQ